MRNIKLDAHSLAELRSFLASQYELTYHLNKVNTALRDFILALDIDDVNCDCHEKSKESD